MLRVESNTDMKGFTEYEEDILFDEDDPDFDNNNVTSIPVPLLFRGSKIQVKPRVKPSTHITFSKILGLQLFGFASKLNDYNPFSEKINQINRYWLRQSIPEVIEDADKLFKEENYLEAYLLLNRIKFHNNVDVQWRICRALYKMSCNDSLSHNVRNDMILEAYDMINNTVLIGPDNASAHKWMAIITDAKTGIDGIAARVKSLSLVKAHLERAVQLNPNDVSVLYMLGKWCFEMSNLKWYQRTMSALLLIELPTSTYEEAYKYFLQAEEIKPRFYLPNLYMLGRASFHMKQYFRARYYLNIAATLPPRTKFEKQCAAEARTMASELQQFDVAKDALLYGLPPDIIM